MLKDIFNSITPENLKNIPLMQDAMDIFIETLEEKCEVSQDIKTIFDLENTEAREEFIKIYLDDLNRYLTKAKTDPAISNRIEKTNELYGVEVIPRDFIGDLTKLFNDEHFVTSKAFKQKKGTKVAIEYIYNLVESMLDDVQNQSSFVFTPGEPFEFTVEGSIHKEMYDGIVKALADPLGFTYVYLQVIKLALHDYYQIEYQYQNVEVEVRCLEGNTDVYNGDDVVDIQESMNGEGQRITRVVFENDTYLEQITSPIHVVYYAANGDVIQDYSGHCSLYLTYNLVVNILTTDEIAFEAEHEFDDGYWKDYSNPGLIGSITIGEFFIGGYTKYEMPELLEFHVDYDPTISSVIYGVPVDYLGFTIGTTIIGDSSNDELVGYGLEKQVVETTEFYDARVEVDDNDFTIEII